MDQRRLSLLFLCLLGVIYVTGAENDCGTSFSMSNGFAMYAGRETTVNNTVPLACMPGYSLHGDEHMTCLQNESWHHISHCEPVDCSTNYWLDNGHVSFTGKATTYGHIVPVSCDEGYQLHGDRYITCKADGNWTHGSSCQLRDCGTSYDIEHGHVDFPTNSTKVNDTLRVYCQTGYTARLVENITCQPSGLWSRSGVCKLVDCRLNYEIEHGYAEYGHTPSGVPETTYGSHVWIFCNDAYNLVGDNFTVCQADGFWSRNTVCQVEDCGTNYTLPNGHVNFTGHDTTYHSKVPIHCDANGGYLIEGDAFITCQANGLWSRNSHCVPKDCGDHYHLDNGHVNFTERATTYSETIPVTCSEGYDLVGHNHITCGLAGWTKDMTCQIKDCGMRYHIEHGYANFEGHETTFGSHVPIFCSKGHILEGDAFTKCQKDGNWSQNTTCHVVDCGTNYTLPNGHVDFTGHDTKYHSKVPIHCDANGGYQIEGDAFITCLSNGTWSKTSHCALKDCGAHYEIDNGHVNFTGTTTTYGETIQVTCNEGYNLIGLDHIKCLSNGWTISTACQVKDCGTPKTVSHGYSAATVDGTTVNRTARVVCQEGYRDEGDSYITCQSDGHWSTYNQCRIIECDSYHHIEHGHVDFTGWTLTYDHMVPFTCNPGYETEDLQFLRCMSNGNWSTASCRPKDCKTLFHLEHGHVDFVGEDTTFGSTISVVCNEGYDIQGQDHIYCGEDGIWIGSVACRPTDCGTTYTLEHGYASFDGMSVSFGATVPIRCVHGYEIGGPDHITCQANKTWTTSSCKIIDCGHDYPVDNGRAHFHGYNTTYGEQIPIHCNVGFYIEGDEYITCLSGGSWSNNSACHIHDCGREYDLDGGEALFTNDSTTYNHTVQLDCHEGYNLTGDGYAVCLDNGTWSRKTQCIIKDCGTVYDLDYGYVNLTDEDTTFNSSVPIHCNSGYKIHGHPEITCLDDGWSNASSCKIVDCGGSVYVHHGHANFTGKSTTFNQTIQIFCNLGYEIHGEHYITCLAGGNWSDTTTCNAVDCGTNYTLPHGHVDFTGRATTYNQSIPVMCELEYEIHGKDQITCLDDGQWSEESECTLKNCGTNYTLPHGHVNFTGRATTYNQSIPVLCEFGYEIHGKDQITCLDDGQWSEGSECTIKDCGTNYTLPHGHVNFTDRATTVNQSIPVMCELGYKIHGNGHITCLNDGQWSEESECTIKDCGTNYTLPHGYVNFTGKATTYNRSIPVMCELGYKIDGKDHITCLDNGQWSEETECTKTDCGTAFHIENGHANFTDRPTTYGESVLVMCDEGYLISGEYQTTCLANGSWTHLTSCVLRDCGSTHTINYGDIDFAGKETTFNHSVPVTCHSGYTIEGPDHIACLSSGYWSNETKCILTGCGTLISLPNGHANFTDRETTFNNSVPLFCISGYDLDGEDEATCGHDGSWSFQTTCQIKDCGDNYTIEHGHVNFTDYLTTYSNTVPVHCNVGYNIEGDAEITCDEDGSWTTNTQCHIVECSTSYTLEHGHVNFTGWEKTFNQSVPILCFDGHEPYADHHITCLENGTWGGHAMCVLKDCGESHVIDHGHVNFTGHLTTFNQTVPVTCNDGYTLVGEAVITCEEDGSWSDDTHCHPKDCGSEFTLDNGHVDFTGRQTTYGSTVPVSCNQGYGIHGTGHITCQTDGTWGGTGECLIKDCGATYTLNHGSVNFTGHATTYNGEIPVTCNEGYEIEGDPKIKCLATGDWSETTSCRAKPAAEEDDDTGVIVGATVGGVAAVALVSAVVIAIIQKKGLLCFMKSYSLGAEAVNSTPVPPKTLY